MFFCSTTTCTRSAYDGGGQMQSETRLRVPLLALIQRSLQVSGVWIEFTIIRVVGAHHTEGPPNFVCTGRSYVPDTGECSIYCTTAPL